MPIRANRQFQVERLELGDAHHWSQPFRMDCRKHCHVKCVDSWICLVGNPEKAKGCIYGELQPPAPSDDFPDLLKGWGLVLVLIAHATPRLGDDYGKFLYELRPLSRQVGHLDHGCLSSFGAGPVLMLLC